MESAIAHPVRKPKNTPKVLNMRMRQDTRFLIEQAAAITGKTLTDFVTDAARLAAQNALLDRATISVGEKAYSAFVALLDAPPQPNERLRKSLQTPAIWE